jgi:hypothetical protein
MYNTVENNYEAGTTYTKLGVILGKEENMDVYANNYPQIPLSTFSNGYVVNGAVIGQLLQ